MMTTVDGVEVFQEPLSVWGTITGLVEKGVSDDEVIEIVINQIDDDTAWRWARRHLAHEVKGIRRDHERRLEAQARRELESAEERQRRLAGLADERVAARKAGVSVKDWRRTQRDARFAESVEELEATLRKVFRAAEFTDAFLNSTFPLPDGEIVTWMDATVEQHEARIRMLEKLIFATSETLALHLEFVDALRVAGASTYREMQEMAE